MKPCSDQPDHEQCPVDCPMRSTCAMRVNTSPAPRAVISQCRDCDQPFTVPGSKAHRIGKTKWYSLCQSCLRWEL